MKPQLSADDSPTGPAQEERRRLANVHTRVTRAMDAIDARLAHAKRDIQAQKSYMWESRSEMDHLEKIAARQSIEQSVTSGEFLLARRKRLEKLCRSPYFGRVDFARRSTPGTEPEAGPEPCYIGIHGFFDEHDQEHIVYDWRAPISTLFYDFETGAAAFESPDGEVRGEITRKRQLRIRDGELQLVFESGLNIVDDVLQEELAHTSDEGMRNIVATIQRDQNAIVRNEDAHTLVIQGVAGSGKTSIALHRVAFLLYRFRDTLSSKDILIISPNRVFADYISNVLPELGEESIREIGMEQLADELLDHEYRFQSFFEQTAALAEKHDEALRRRIEFKASADFLERLGEYAAHVEANRFVAVDIRLGQRIIPDTFIAEAFARHPRVALTERLRRVLNEIETAIRVHYRYEITPEERRTLRDALKGMHRSATLRQTYKACYDWLGKPELFQGSRGRLEYADVFPLVFLKMRLEGLENPYRETKHLLIDEMQDYTPVQYAVLARLFTCRKTVLGDVAQSVNPYSASSIDDVRRALFGASFVKLTRSYRSTLQVMEFAQQISPDPDLVPMQRHGPPPRVIRCRTHAEEFAAIRGEIETFRAAGEGSLGMLCKTDRQARRLARDLTEAGIEYTLFDEHSTAFSRGVVVCSIHLAKGLEFDHVLVPGVTESAYATPMDRNLLYVACTRAMHGLVLTHTGKPSGFLPATEE
ncbi:MAG: HelD family protein [Gammaproteobacteria bacterium]